MKWQILLCFCFILIKVQGQDTGDFEYEDAKALYDYLTENKTNANIVPICKRNQKVLVTVELAVRELVELDEKKQILCAKVWLRLAWNDCSLKWNPADFGNLTKIVMPYENVWQPDITLYEGASEEANMPDKTEYKAWVHSNGRVTYNFPSVTTTTCRIDVTYFPFDYQNCSLKFGSWNFDGNQIDFRLQNSEADTSAFVIHNEWELVSAHGIRHESYYELSPEPYPDITYYIVLARRPKFYFVTLFFPSIVILGLSLLGFMLPPESGEKINIQITVLLSISVFLLLVQDKLPCSSQTFPQIGIYFSIAMLLTCLSCVKTSIVMYIHLKQETTAKPPPRWLRKSVEVMTLNISCKRRRKPRNTDDVKVKSIRVLEGDVDSFTNIGFVSEENGDVKHNGQVADVDLPEYKERESSTSSYSLSHEEEKEWELLSLAIDRLFMLLYFIFMVLNICVYLFWNWSELGRFWQ
ncbi:hypothetical protein FSP39_021616 [Pinctada imbricata]|uniref:Uncharacterized protein n=1 Tax=Pinctada imbricata TaxID=66713 RepID=A0AA88YF77_PINIB|nr:hypothetical protein FSP39_021616 [Pinctada imbricata]